MRSGLARTLVLVALPLLAACAAQRAKVPSMEPVAPLEDYIAKVRQASVMARAATAKTSLPTAERFDSELAGALAALHVFPSPERHVQVAAAYGRLGISDKAHEHFSLAAAADPRNASAYDGLARLWRDWGFSGRALPHAHRAVYYAPRSPEARNTLGTVLHRLGQYGEARRQYGEALTLDPAAAYALNNICALDLLEGRPDAAAAACSQALALDPGLVVAQQNLQRSNQSLALADAESQNARH